MADDAQPGTYRAGPRDAPGDVTLNGDDDDNGTAGTVTRRNRRRFWRQRQPVFAAGLGIALTGHRHGHHVAGASLGLAMGVAGVVTIAASGRWPTEPGAGGSAETYGRAAAYLPRQAELRLFGRRLKRQDCDVQTGKAPSLTVAATAWQLHSSPPSSRLGDTDNIQSLAEIGAAAPSVVWFVPIPILILGWVRLYQRVSKR